MIPIVNESFRPLLQKKTVSWAGALLVAVLVHALALWLCRRWVVPPLPTSPSSMVWVRLTPRPTVISSQSSTSFTGSKMGTSTPLRVYPSLGRKNKSSQSIENSKPLSSGESKEPSSKDTSAPNSEKDNPPSLKGPVSHAPPIDLFSKAALNKAIGAVGSGGGPIPTRPDPLVSSTVVPVEKKDVVLEAEKGGGYRHVGQNIVAHIRPDCSVSFEDRFPIGFGKGTFSFDLTDAVEKARRRDPYALEKRRFMDATAASRKKLCEEVLEQKTQQAKEVLESKMSQILREKGSPTEQRKALFIVWVDIGDEPGPSVASRLRQQWLSFVRYHFPSDSSKAYTSEEIMRFDEERKAEGLQISFRPYKEVSAVPENPVSQ